jgi:hypothetical protein
MLQQVHSVTAYGTDFKKGPDANGVLLVNCDTDTQKALEGLLVANLLANTNGPVKKLPGDEQTVYTFANQVFISPVKGGPIIISKSEELIDATRERLAGKGPSLSSSSTFGELPLVGNSFIVLGAAEVLNDFHGIPAQAKVLQMADGGRVALGERAEQVYLDLTLRGKTAEVTHQIQQVIEGMVALVNLGQPDLPDVLDLAKSVKVSSQDRLVTVSMEYPATKVIARLNEAMSPKPPANKSPRHKAKAKSKDKDKDKEERKVEAKSQAAPASEKPEADEQPLKSE